MTVTEIGRIEALWRYPVKSLQGESVAALELSADGPVGDRAWGVHDVAADLVLSAKRVGELLEARVIGEVVELPDGSGGVLGSPGLDVALSAWLGRPARAASVAEHPSLRIEMARDNETEGGGLVRWRSPRGRYVDLHPLHLLASGSLAWLAQHEPLITWAVERFRPNIVVSTETAPFVEDAWLDGVLRIGDVVVDVPDLATERCVMVTRAQPGLERQRNVLRAIATARGVAATESLAVGTAHARLGCYGTVRVAGTIHVGDPVTLER